MKTYTANDPKPAPGGPRRYHPDRGDITEAEHYDLDVAQAAKIAADRARNAEEAAKAAAAAKT